MKYKDIPRDKSGAIIAEKVQFPVEIDLVRPVEVDGTALGSLSLREPTAADVELCWVHDGEMTRMVNLVALLADRKTDDVRTLKSIDFMRAAQVVGAFL